MKKMSLFKVLMLSLGLSFLPFCSLIAALPIDVNGQNNIPSLAPMLAKVLPAVVSVHVEGTQSTPQFAFPVPKEFKYFFGPDFPSDNYSTRPFEGIGSGVIINANQGYIITNNHVITGADQIKVQLNDGRKFNARIIGYDEQTDLALLQLPIDSTNLTEVKMADSDTLKVGDFAIAVGNPFGLDQTVTSGIISALGRSGLHLEGLEHFIQTDASINRGNSGGALVNLKGELIGINTAILAPGGGNIGIGFAIPSNIVKNLSQQLIEFGEVKRSQLGIRGTELTMDIAQAFHIENQHGAFVSEVIIGSAAAKAKIQAGDIILSVDGKPIHNFDELRVKVGTTMPGKTINIGILRNNRLFNIPVILDDNISTIFNQEALTPELQGAILSNWKRKDGTKGILVESIIKGSPAARLGLQQHDLIVGLNLEPVHNLAELRKALERKPTVKALDIMRGDNHVFVWLK
ncbi:Do family serine endopeptidase [Candidatus Palibaumannia cicadellinicola]|uniref:Serine protease n=1 Tax=Baumannia cicadellinicola subsp. Homalodisca coagulata TaxID=374463 RepID=Q1LU56_BAUCH|nr:Do family serine endopeptidase [Candidatus Baumannia cicadellinicola]ABF14165.1 serine protease [Baumannia cicadellinicola str. Hc (Homalodisca coagulata)]MBS0032575.1 Do family serine endopeptidase [Candidatus Baumannia cicadellinicola]MCJ7462017.1 Do family serine endopeptidase [Candidatus Baumannia cicadellinicola]MCJ7462566.1 Do family serine endopeptidase [Candidatus Baumannia cicadellinicola]